MPSKFLLVLLILVPILVFVVLIYGAFSSTKSKIANSKTNVFADYDISQGNFAIKSLSFRHKEDIPEKHTCDGKNTSPTLRFYNIPEDTKSLVLAIIDPDTRFGSFNHWLVWNIDPDIEVIKDSKVPKGAVEGVNDYNQNRYDGPCPPYGEKHEYFFTAYALDTMLDVSTYSTFKDIELEMKGSIIDTFGLVGTYSR